MNTKTQILILALLAALPVAADEPTLRYDLSGQMQLSMEQEIYVANHDEAIASRNFSMTFDLGNNNSPDNDELTVKLSAIKASYTAHGMNQRLPTSHLTGSEFNLLGDGRSYNSRDGGGEVPLGSITDGGLRPSELLAGILPVLPNGPVSIGMKWKSDRSIVSLEGWAWAGGDMQHYHEITDIEHSGGRTVVTVTTHGETAISSAAGHTGFLGEGTLSQSFEWRFDAVSGQLLSLSAEQEASGTNQLPQGEIPFRQIARYELLADG
jgi:hypothetical protein